MNASPKRNTTDRLHSVSSAAEFLGGVSVAMIRNYLWRGLLTRIKVGRRTMVRESELLRLIKPEQRGQTK
ncbi:MAG: helix-turn-helix domain-containing protein [Candidatus Korobacteraceae bacterium]